MPSGHEALYQTCMISTTPVRKRNEQYENKPNKIQIK